MSCQHDSMQPLAAVADDQHYVGDCACSCRACAGRTSRSRQLASHVVHCTCASCTLQLAGDWKEKPLAFHETVAQARGLVNVLTWPALNLGGGFGGCLLGTFCKTFASKSFQSPSISSSASLAASSAVCSTHWVMTAYILWHTIVFMTQDE